MFEMYADGAAAGDSTTDPGVNWKNRMDSNWKMLLGKQMGTGPIVYVTGKLDVETGGVQWWQSPGANIKTGIAAANFAYNLILSLGTNKIADKQLPIYIDKIMMDIEQSRVFNSEWNQEAIQKLKDLLNVTKYGKMAGILAMDGNEQGSLQLPTTK